MPNDNLAMEIKKDEQLDISIERVPKLDSPLLVIGLGGTGSDIVRTIKRTFAERYELPKDAHGNIRPVPSKTAYLALDTDVKQRGGFDNNEFLDISFPGMEVLLNPARRKYNLTEYENKWVNKNLNAASNGFGAGTHRQAARFMLSRNYNLVYNALLDALTSITSVQHGNAKPVGRTEIVIVTGICGGTGSGLFLDIPQIVRHLMQSEAQLHGLKYQITGYIVMPDITIANVNGDASQKTIFQQNGFAALKELDFWMRADIHQTPYSMEYSGSGVISWNMRPFNSCVLISGINVRGTVYTDGYTVMQKTIAENLLHYLANESLETKADGTIEYTYISYEDNLGRMVTALNKRLPLFYGYRAIGAYTKHIPKKKVLYHEGTRLFETFIPPRDSQGRLVPNAALLQDGKAVLRAQGIVGDVKTLYSDFARIVKLHSVCMVEASEKERLDQLRSLQPPPHDRVDSKPGQWLSSVVKPAAAQTAVAYLDAAWSRFQSFAKNVISDPQLGPFSLRAYLTDPSTGLSAAIKEMLVQWNGASANITGGISTKYENCKNTWADFLRPPMMSARKSVDAYLNALRDYYDAVRKSAFIQSHTVALDKLIRRISDYLRDSLGSLCDDLLHLQEEFKETGYTEKDFESDLFDLAPVRTRIDDDFVLANANGAITVGFLNELFDECFKTATSVDDHGSGVSFEYRSNGMNNLLMVMRKHLDNCFGEINGQSLDSIMRQTAGDDVGRQQAYMDDLANSVVSSALPLFSQDRTAAAEDVASYSYLSVPDNAKMHIERFKNTLGNKKIVPKGSALHDHIYCITAWDGLPLYRYSLMESMEKIYDDNLKRVEMSMGVHLVWDGEPNSDYTVNWTRLPSPRPYYFFGAHGVPNAEKTFEDARELVRRARDAGMLIVDASGPLPTISLRVFYENQQQRTVKLAQQVVQEVETLMRDIDPATGAKYTRIKQKQRLQAYLDTAVVDTIPSDKKPTCMAAWMGLSEQPCDPWDQGISGNPTAMAKARANHKVLCDELATAVISTMPMTLSVLDRQVSGFESIHEALQRFVVLESIWDPRIVYADQVAAMLGYGLFEPSTSGWRYRTYTGELVSVIQPTLLAGDIVADTSLVQLTAYLGDLRDDNQMRVELEQLLQNRKDELQAGVDSASISKDHLAANIALIDKFNTILKADIDTQNSALKAPNGDVERTKLVLGMLRKLESGLSIIRRGLENTMMFI